MTDLTEAARIVGGWPRVLVRLLDAHVAGPDGRCRGCTSQVSLAPQWPCALTEFARLAAAIPPDGRGPTTARQVDAAYDPATAAGARRRTTTPTTRS